MAGRLSGKVASSDGCEFWDWQSVSASLFAREGAKVVVSDVSVDGGQETVRLIISQRWGGNLCQSRCLASR